MLHFIIYLSFLLKKNAMNELFVLKTFMIHIEIMMFEHVESFTGSQSRACIYTYKACYKLSLTLLRAAIKLQMRL